MSPVSTLLAWYKRHKRDLPWRRTRDPYHILVSEIMLQQTQVDRGIVYYARFLKRFPSWKALSTAKTADLLRAWAGLGYNRRALQLREAAKHVVANGVPRSIAEWQRLKGIGPYTAAAVYAISKRKRMIAIDTNVRRVAGRLLLGIPYPVLSDDERIARALDRVVPKRDVYWMLPQAFMDLGTAICTSKNPSCATCPLQTDCRAAKKFLSGHVGEKPRTISTERKHRNKPFPDRIYRGRILAAVREGRAREIKTLGPIIDASFDVRYDTEWLRSMITRLMNDGMLEQRGTKLALPRH